MLKATNRAAVLQEKQPPSSAFQHRSSGDARKHRPIHKKPPRKEIHGGKREAKRRLLLPEQGVDEALDLEWREVIGTLAQANKLDWDA